MSKNSSRLLSQNPLKEISFRSRIFFNFFDVAHDSHAKNLHRTFDHWNQNSRPTVWRFPMREPRGSLRSIQISHSIDKRQCQKRFICEGVAVTVAGLSPAHVTVVHFVCVKLYTAMEGRLSYYLEDVDGVRCALRVAKMCNDALCGVAVYGVNAVWTRKKISFIRFDYFVKSSQSNFNACYCF